MHSKTKPERTSNSVDYENGGLLGMRELDQYDHHQAQRTKRGALHHVSFIACLLFTWWCVLQVPAALTWAGKDVVQPILREHDISTETDNTWDFADITPSEKLEWHPCLGQDFQCARLTVPMDYHRPLNASSNNPKVHIALLMIPGANSSPQKASVSPLLLNPGGPGGSGVAIAISMGRQIQKIVGEDQDIIGFDPRGIGATVPRTDCFSYPYEDSMVFHEIEEEDYARGWFHRMLWVMQYREVGLVNSTPSSLQQLDTRARTVAKLCQEKDDIAGKDSILKYAHTPSVARDMLSIVDAWDKWTETLEVRDCHYFQADDELTKNQNHEGVSHSSDTKGKLVYWGFSYGTLLGATFASMFPDRVGRVILDGVVDADHYVSPYWEGSLRDTDAISDSFATYCHAAKEACALYGSDDTVVDIETRFDNAIRDLRNSPMSAINPTTKTPEIFTYSDLRSLLFAGLYFPVAIWPLIAILINMLSFGQGELVAQWFTAGLALDVQPFCAVPRPASEYPNDAQIAIMCSDKRHTLNETLPALEKAFFSMANESTWADVWMTVMMGCEAWSIKAVDPPMRWDDNPALNPKPIKTSHPLFFISNTHDPVTPLTSGLKMAKKFEGAGLLEQLSQGHCSLAAVSLCTAEKIRKYFQTGELPPPPILEGDDLSEGQWEKCVADEWPFHPFTPSSDMMTQKLETEESTRADAMKEMQGEFRKLKHWGQPSIDHAGLETMIYLSEIFPHPDGRRERESI